MHRKYIFTMLFAAGVLLIAAGIWLATANPVSAQCGSSASSCKNCHEVQGTMPVNNDGTAWHTSHAFGDFCYICHAGNQQATDETGAHTGMVPPLSDIKASCVQCHPNDLQARAQVYAIALGIEIGSDTSTGTTTTSTGNGTEVSTQPEVNAPATTELDVNDPNLVNYVQNYDQIVLGKFPTNWGNVILLVMIGMLAVGGGGFVIINEKLVKVSFGDTKKAEGEYPSEVVDMLPAIARLKSKSRKSLKNILDNPKKTEEVLNLIDVVVSDKESEE
ncbi:MAG: hypothetical protein ABIJ65_02935 [Chloroflexota bacterium]